MPAFTRSELADLNVFMTIVRRRSFRHAAHELGVSTSALSHSMRNLETRLGVKLLNRTSRSVVPTAAGQALADKLDTGFQSIREALSELDVYRAAPAGRLSLNVPRDAARLLLRPVLKRFCQSYPDIQLEITVEDRLLDIVADGFDAGIRYGSTVPQDMVAVPLTEELRWIVVAAPEYLARHGTPQHPADLLRHRCIRMRLGDNTHYKWELGNGVDAVHVDVPGPLSTNETDATVAAAVDGVGLAYCLEVRVADELRNGTLHAVLPEWASLGPPLCLYYPSRHQAQPGLRQLADMIREQWRAI
ncbi:LysR family transcriptional regulator [Aquipseudomonas campi]